MEAAGEGGGDAGSRGGMISGSNMQRNLKMTLLSGFCRGLAGRWPWWPPAVIRHLSSRGPVW